MRSKCLKLINGDIYYLKTYYMGLAAIIKMAGNMVDMPEEIIVYAVKIENDGLFSTKLSLEVKKAVREVMALVKKEMTAAGFGI